VVVILFCYASLCLLLWLLFCFVMLRFVCCYGRFVLRFVCCYGCFVLRFVSLLGVYCIMLWFFLFVGLVVFCLFCASLCLLVWLCFVCFLVVFCLFCASLCLLVWFVLFIVSLIFYLLIMNILTPQESKMVDDLLSLECFPIVSDIEQKLFIRMYGLTTFQYVCIFILAIGTHEERQRKNGLK